MKKGEQTEKPRVLRSYDALPLSFKIFFWIFVFGFITSLNAPFRSLEYGYGFLGMLIPGITGFLLASIITVAGEALRLVSFVKKKSWTWKFLLSYQAFLVINQILAFVNLKENASQIGIPETLVGLGGILIMIYIAVEIVFLYFVRRNKEVFNATTLD